MMTRSKRPLRTRFACTRLRRMSLHPALFNGARAASAAIPQETTDNMHLAAMQSPGLGLNRISESFSFNASRLSLTPLPRSRSVSIPRSKGRYGNPLVDDAGDEGRGVISKAHSYNFPNI